MSGLEGATLGRYQITGRLGRGGMSEVYLAYDEHMHRQVAIKVVGNSHTEYIERFRREAEAIGRLTHDHILPAFDFGEQDMWHYLVMPYIENGTLRKLIEQGPMELEHVNELLEQIASALHFAHEEGIIHRDIKPSNILLRDDHYTYLADFGLAKVLEGGGDLTQTGSLLGTPEYMAPELSAGPATTSSDIYALGVLLYQMVTGTVPFVGETPLSVYWKQIQEAPLPPSELNPHIPYAIELVILTALEKDPTRRYQSAMDLATAFQRALAMPDQEELEELPPVYDPITEEVMPEHVPPHHYELPAQEEQLVLPTNPVAAPTATATATAVKNKRFSRISRTGLPPMPPLKSMRPSRRRRSSGGMDTVASMELQEEPQAISIPEATTPARRRSVIRQRRSLQDQQPERSHRLLIGLLVAIILILLIAIFVILFYSTLGSRADLAPLLSTYHYPTEAIKQIAILKAL